MTIVRFTQQSGYTHYHTDWDGNLSGEYVPLAEYQQAVNLVNELGEENVQSRLQVDKLKALIQRVNEIGPELDHDIHSPPRDFVTTQSTKLTQLLKDIQEAVA